MDFHLCPWQPCRSMSHTLQSCPLPSEPLHNHLFPDCLYWSLSAWLLQYLCSWVFVLVFDLAEWILKEESVSSSDVRCDESSVILLQPLLIYTSMLSPLMLVTRSSFACLFFFPFSSVCSWSPVAAVIPTSPVAYIVQMSFTVRCPRAEDGSVVRTGCKQKCHALEHSVPFVSPTPVYSS